MATVFTYVVIAVQINLIREVVCRLCRIRKVNQRIPWCQGGRSQGLLPGAEERFSSSRRMITRHLLWKVDAQVRGDRHATVCSAVTGVITSKHPSPGRQVIDVDVIKPDTIQILTTDDEKSIPRNRREMGIARFGKWNERVLLHGPRWGHPTPRRDIVEADIIQDAEILRAFIRFWLQPHTAEYDEVLVPWQR